MTLLGRLLRNRRAGDAHAAWNHPQLQGPDLLTVTSDQFEDGGSMPRQQAGKQVGGRDVSPHLAWTAPPPGTTELLIVVEDLDVPMSKPAVHCLALVNPSQLINSGQLPLGALSGKAPGAGVRILRSTIGRGYHGPGPIKGHGPHRYVFQLFALGGEPTISAEADLERTRPRALLQSATATVTARGRLTGTYER